MRTHQHALTSTVAIGGGFRSFRRKIEKEAGRAVSKAGDALQSAGEHVVDQTRRDLRHFDAEVRRTWRNIGRVYDEAGEEVDQFVRQTGKNGIAGHALRDFARNPEYWYAIGSVLVLVPGMQLVGAALIAAASVRMERNKRKQAEEDARNQKPPVVGDGDLPWLNDPIGSAAEFIRRHPIAVAVGLGVLYYVTRQRRRK